MLRYQCATSDLLPTTYAWAQAAGGGRGRDEAFLARARRVFDSYDAKGAGRLSRQETKLAWLALLGCKPSRCELADLLAPEPAAQRGGGEEDEGADHMGDRRVVWARFAEAAVRRRAGIDGSDEVRQAFKAFDRRCAGFLTLADVKAVFREVAAHVNERTGETGSCTTRMQGRVRRCRCCLRCPSAPDESASVTCPPTCMRPVQWRRSAFSTKTTTGLSTSLSSSVFGFAGHDRAREPRDSARCKRLSLCYSHPRKQISFRDL